jgi:PAS domain-containing protein
MFLARWAAREAALDPSDPKPLAIEHRIQRGDGEVRWVEAHGLAHFEGNGRYPQAVSLVGTVADITERKQREEERKEREEKERLLMREISAPAADLGVIHHTRVPKLAASCEGRELHCCEVADVERRGFVPGGRSNGR